MTEKGKIEIHLFKELAHFEGGDEDSRLDHNNDFKNVTCCSSACAGHNEFE